MEILSSYMIPQSIATKAIPAYIKMNQSQRGDASQLEATSMTYPTDSPTATRLGLFSSLVHGCK